MIRFFALCAVWLAVLGAAPPNWVNTVTLGQFGSFVMGNPKAKVKLVEHVSYTCPACARFVGTAAEPLKRDYVAKGLVSVELRNFLFNQFDLTAALVARCGPPAKFYGNTEMLYANQSTWYGEKAFTFAEANKERMAKLPITDQMKLLLRGMGLDSLMKSRGYTPAQLDACVSDRVSLNRVLAMTEDAQKRGIHSTPTFVINGARLDNIGGWPILEQLIKSTLERK